jgi:hypothetical protein
MRISTILLALAVAVPCSAQTGPSSLPADLVTALFAGGQAVGRGATFSVGELPAGWPAALNPPGSSPLGGMAYGRTLVALFADTARRPLANYLAFLGEAGYSQPAPQGGSGFMSSRGPYAWHCRDSTNVVATMVPAPANTRWLRVSYTTGIATACVTREPAHPAPPRAQSTLALPELPPPAGLSAGRAGSGASENEVSSYTVLSGTSVSPAALLEHYTALLTAAGWTAAGATSDSTAAAQLFRARDSSGRTWHGVLSVFATKTGRDAFIDMRPEEASNGVFR